MVDSEMDIYITGTCDIEKYKENKRKVNHPDI